MRATCARIGAARRRLVLAPLAGVLLTIAPAAFAQQPTPAAAPHDTSTPPQLQQMMGMLNQMGPMYETMMKSMVDGTLKAMGQPENIERMAVFARGYYEALIRHGFTKDEALHIVAGVGVPTMKMGK